MRMNRILRIAGLVVTLASLLLGAGVPAASAQQTSKSGLERARKIYNKAEEGLAFVSAVADALVFVADKLEPEGDVTITRYPVHVQDPEVELGLTLKVPYEVRYQFAQGWGYDEGAVLAQLYVILSGKVVHWEYYALPDDRDHDFTIRGSLYLGAKSWPCKNVVDELKFVALLHNKNLGGYNFSEEAHEARVRHERGRRNDPELDMVGFWAFGPSYNGPTQIDGAMIDSEEVVLRRTVINPYYIETKKSDHGLTKPHGATFDLVRDVVMNYSVGYTGFPPFAPEPRKVDVRVTGLESTGGWTFGPTPPRIQFVAGLGAHDSASISQSGGHTAEHPPGSGRATYSFTATTTGAAVTGRNRVWRLQKSGAGLVKVAEPYSFQALFRSGPGSDKCDPMVYSVVEEAP